MGLGFVRLSKKLFGQEGTSPMPVLLLFAAIAAAELVIAGFLQIPELAGLVFVPLKWLLWGGAIAGLIWLGGGD